MYLTDGTIVLRPPQPRDADALIGAVGESHVEVGRWLGWAHAGYGRADVDAYLALARAERPFLVFDAADARLLGGVGLTGIDPVNQRANLGYWARTSATGRGVTTRAARLVAWYGHAHLGLHRLEIVVAVGNLASEAVAAKLGAPREGVLRGRILLPGGHVDAVVHALLPADTAGWAERYGLQAAAGRSDTRSE